jgi:threonine synthase
VKYISTRGKAPALGFEEVLLTGLASDGGLYVPETLPHYDAAEIASWSGLSYAELALRIIQPFVADAIDDADLRAIIDDTYAQFRHDAVAPLVQLGHNEWVLELFHGPTLAFKDFALQLLGRLFDYVLERRQQRVVIMGATSGDTGSAAIEGCRRCKHVDIFILHPHQRVSEVQRRQMTTVAGDNIHNLAVEGNFDDCQALVKQSFADQSFLPNGLQLVAVNSINWARIMAQMVYYFSSALALGAPHRPVSFAVPTGNFGDIYAGWLAKNMGLPIEQLVIGTNSNDILHRFMCQNQYQKHQLVHSLSPSMDIMISSNFERALFDFYERDGEAVADLMERFNRETVSVPDAVFERARAVFDSHAVDDARTIDVIRQVYESTGYLLDPHSAIGLEAGRQCRRNSSTPMVTLATAHPAKFPQAVMQAGQSEEPGLPHYMSDLYQRPERYSVLDGDLATVQGFIADNISGSA